MTDIKPLRDFIRDMTRLADEGATEQRWLNEGAALLRRLVATDTWLPEDCAVPGPRYRQYLLHCDPLERFSVVSFVWGPGQQTPVHDHTVWGLIGMLRGQEASQPYAPDATGAMRPCRRMWFSRPNSRRPTPVEWMGLRTTSTSPLTPCGRPRRTGAWKISSASSMAPSILALPPVSTMPAAIECSKPARASSSRTSTKISS